MSFIKSAQRLLKSAGLYSGIIDGDFGAGSLKAVELAIQKSGIETITTKQVPPAWIVEAQKHIGLKEIVGVRHNLTILQWVKNLGGWFTTDEVPWCGTFIAQCLKEGGRGIPKHWYRALDYQKYGTQLAKPAYGCIGVMARSGGGHVTFIVGETEDGYLIGLGGNQSNAVNLAKFPKSRFTAFVWASYADGTLSSPYPTRYDLPVYSSDLINLSISEA